MTAIPAMILRRLVLPAGCCAAIACFSGCVSHAVKFDNASYAVAPSAANANAKTAVVAVISPETLAMKKTISSWMTGIAHKWDAEPGAMLRDVAQIEFSQAFQHYELSSVYAEPKTGDRKITVELSIPSYDFAEFRASVAVRAVVSGPGHAKLLEKTYSADGATQGSKMFWAGAFGMKSAIRQSSLDAFKKIFVELRADIEKALAAPPAA